MKQQNAQNANAGSVVPPDFDNREIMERLTRYLLRHCWNNLSDWQRVRPPTWLHDGNRIAPRVTGLRIAADGDHQGYLIRVEDCALDEPSVPHDENPVPSFADRYRDFDEAAAVTEILKRKGVV